MKQSYDFWEPTGNDMANIRDHVVASLQGELTELTKQYHNDKQKLKEILENER